MKLFIQKFKNLRFKQKLILSYSMVVIIPIVILGMFSYQRARFYLEEQAQNKVKVSLIQMADNINHRIKQYINVANFIVVNKQIQYILKYEYSDMYEFYIDIVHYLGPTLVDILYINNDIDKITIYCSNDVPESPFIIHASRVDDLFWYKDAQKKLVIHYNEDRIIAVRKIVDINNNVTNLGVLYMEINASKLFEGIYDTIFDQYGIVILDENKKAVFVKNTFHNKKYVLDGSQLPDENMSDLRIGADTYFFIKSDIPDSDWTIHFYTPKKFMSVDARDIIKATALITGICVIILGLIIWLFSNTFVKRIYRLNMMMQRVENGDMQVDISSQSSDEIGELINRFSMMLKRINSLIDDVYQSKITQKEAEFKALQAQINPHFLYNALSLINWKARMIYAKDISDIANTVSTFYRTTLNNGNNIISIRDEIENTQAYLEIQSAMHDYSFEVNYDFEEELYQYDTIKLILQPIAENCINHGIDKKKEGKGIINVKGHIIEDHIEFLISDNGPGMEKEIIDSIFVKQSIGYGLINVHNRIQLFFGNAYGISISSKIGEGTQVILKLPKYIIHTDHL